MNPQQIDIGSFTQQSQQWQGRTALSKLERVLEETRRQPSDLASKDAVESQIDWHLAGETVVLAGTGGAREAWVSLRATWQAPLQCQRCLTALTVPVAVQKRYRFVATEAQAAELDADTDAFDVLVSSRQFDFEALLEDELLMALPMAPRHDECPVSPADHTAPVVPEQTLEGKPNPFAALAALKTRSLQ